MSRTCLEAVLEQVPGSRDPLGTPYPSYVLAQFADSGTSAALSALAEQALLECAERGALEDVALAHSEAQAQALWRLRESIPEAQFRNVKHDVSVPVSRVPELIARASTALEAAFPGAQIFAFGHIGDGNVHFNVGMGDPAATEDLILKQGEVNRVVYEVVDALGGSISAEHGLGQLKREEIRRHKPPLELELMRSLKDAIDPLGLMNPGKVL